MSDVATPLVVGLLLSASYISFNRSMERGGSLCPFSRTSTRHSGWMTLQRGMDFRFWCDCSPGFTLTCTFFSGLKTVIFRRAGIGSASALKRCYINFHNELMNEWIIQSSIICVGARLFETLSICLPLHLFPNMQNSVQNYIVHVIYLLLPYI